ncbi:MAG: hypothetical protein SPL08_00145, partial [Pseudomonadota bacterium]|nr:hypothetical protein [Pseudomonadota bacterium]
QGKLNTTDKEALILLDNMARQGEAIKYSLCGRKGLKARLESLPQQERAEYKNSPLVGTCCKRKLTSAGR